MDNVKLPAPVKKTNFMKDFTGEEVVKSEEEELKAQAYQQELKEQEQMMSSILYDMKQAWYIYDT